MLGKIDLVEIVAAAIWNCDVGLTKSVAYEFLEESSRRILKQRAVNVLDKMGEVSPYITLTKQNGGEFALANILIRRILQCEKLLEELNDTYSI